ncbi:hypothetical protein BX616_001453 [Lobosporangium transversale]|nr:hypothetical protein BX616_001453 [Lobosporangium transversale]
MQVRDEQGRRRFHGAFTGGFSAGYYNTVGSKEGWAPSEFVSSRDKRSERKIARPEDFMDEEDKQMLSDSARLVATSDFDTIGSSRRDLEHKRATARHMQESGGILGALPDTLIDDLVVPSSEPVGIRLLKRMGWKPGQGIGPRVSRRQRKPEDGPISDEDIPTNVSFAPIDSAIVIFTNKTNRQGLGYDPYRDAPEFDRSLQSEKESKYLSSQSEGKKATFGFGAFDDDDDEDDVYGSGPGPLRSFDLAMDLEDRPRSRRKSLDESKRFQPEGLSSICCSDGRRPLPGFVLAAAPSKPMKWYSAPKVPDDFVPHHIFPDDVKPVQQTNKHEQPKLTADDRALILGETPIDAPRRSVFEYMSAENKSHLDNILGFVMDTEGDKRLRKDHWEVPKIEKAAAEAALRGFIPFGDNIPKQNRYKQYLNIQAGILDEKIELVPGFSAEDMTKELNEFVQAARIFKPLSSSMANRFTAATKVIEFAQPTAGLRSAEDIKAAERSGAQKPVVEKIEVPKSQAARAAAMGMFGPLTRTVVDFYPSKLLCKRLNVPNPHPDHKGLGSEAVKDLLDKKTMERMMMNRIPGEGMAIENKSTKDQQQDIASGEQETEEAKPEMEPEVIQERPPMDIFKAIFDDSGSDTDTDLEADDPGFNQGNTTVEAAEKEKIPEPASEQGPGEPFRPVFTRKADRAGGLSASLPTRISQTRSSKPDLSHLDEDEEDADEIGPKLSIAKPKTTASKRTTSETDTRVSSQHEVEHTVTSEADSLTTEALRNKRDRSESPDGFIGPPAPELSQAQEKHTILDESSVSFGSKETDSHSLKRHRTLSPSSSHRPSSSYKEGSSSRHKSRSERSREQLSNSSKTRHRSTSRSRRKKSRHHDNAEDHNSESSDRDELTDHEDNTGRRRKHKESSSSSKSKSKRHREHRSRSRSRSPSSRSHKGDRDKDRERGKDRIRESDRSKRSKSGKYKSRHRDRAEKDEGSDMESLWVEKKVDIPISAEQLPPPPPSRPLHRVRASDFF